MLVLGVVLMVVHVSVSRVLEYYYPFIKKVPKEQLLLGLTVERYLYEHSYYFRNKCVYHPRVKMEVPFGGDVIVVHGEPDFVDFFRRIIYEVKLDNPHLHKRNSKYRKRVQLQLSYYYYMLGGNHKLMVLPVKVEKKNGELVVDIPVEVMRARDVPIYFKKAFEVEPLPYSVVVDLTVNYVRARASLRESLGSLEGFE